MGHKLSKEEKEEQDRKYKEIHTIAAKKAIEKIKPDSILKKTLVFPKTVLGTLGGAAFEGFKDSDAGQALLNKIKDVFLKNAIPLSCVGVLGVAAACIIEMNQEPPLDQETLKKVIRQELNLFSSNEKMKKAEDDIETIQTRLTIEVYDSLEEWIEDIKEAIKLMQSHCTTLKHSFGGSDQPTRLLGLWTKCATFVIVSFVELAFLTNSENPKDTSSFKNALSYAELYSGNYEELESSYKLSKKNTVFEKSYSEESNPFGENSTLWYYYALHDKEMDFCTQYESTEWNRDMYVDSICLSWEFKKSIDELKNADNLVQLLNKIFK